MRPLILILFAASICDAEDQQTWSARLGWPVGTRVLILHADDIGMCYEANVAAKNYLQNNHIQSAALMVPCPWYNEMADWYKQNPSEDLGLHLALTSEWKWYRWGPVADRSTVPGLLDKDNYLHRDVRGVAMNASPKEIEVELRAQIEKALRSGPRPGHIDTHMGTLYARPDYTEVYLNLAQEYRIPAMVIEASPETISKFREQGYPFNDDMIKVVKNYSLPKLDDFHSIEFADDYQQKKQKFYAQVKSMKSGLHELIFHPSIETEGLRNITNSWKQRVWEAQMFADPEVQRFLEIEKIEFTNWKEIMQRFESSDAAGKN
ncbi:MAG: polysaccharide deacetylase family protein [Planctomycetales bacterium]|nr:polysaccharide deacetylase family protein [Planctomycetales bacterium]